MKKNITEILPLLKSLKSWELEYIIFNLLVDKKLDYVKLGELYVESLKVEKDKKNLLISKMGMWLSWYWQTPKKIPLFVKTAAAFILIKSGCMGGSALEKELQEHMKKNKYDEDEHGFPITKIKN